MNSGVLVKQAHVALLGGDVVAAMLLAQIGYWNLPGKNGKTKLRVFRGGCLWLAKSAAQWHAELGMTPKQASRGISVLEAKGLIETKVMLFSGHPTKHIRLTEEGHKVVNAAPGNFHLPATTNPFALQGKSLTETTAETTAEKDPAGKPAETVNTQDDKKGNEKSEVKEDAKLPENVTQKKETVLAKLWRERYAAKYPGFQKELTNQEHGQLKQLRKKLGQQAAVVLEFSFQDWSKVVWKAQVSLKITTPSKPVVGWLLAHYDVVMDLVAQDEANKQSKLQHQKLQAEQEKKIKEEQANLKPQKMEPIEVHVFDETDKALLQHFKEMAAQNAL